MSTEFQITEGFDVEFEGTPTLEEAIKMVAASQEMGRAGVEQKSNSNWVMARLILKLKGLHGEDFFYQGLGDQDISEYSVGLALRTAEEFTPEEVARFPNLYYSHFAAISRNRGLDHDQKIHLLLTANDVKVSVRDLKEALKAQNDTAKKIPIFISTTPVEVAEATLDELGEYIHKYSYVYTAPRTLKRICAVGEGGMTLEPPDKTT